MPTRLAVAGLDEAVEEARRPLMVAIGVLSLCLVVLAMCALYLWRKGQRARRVAPALQQPLLTEDHPAPRHYSVFHGRVVPAPALLSPCRSE
jgi:hypothetical protein